MPRVWYNSNTSSPEDAVRNEVEIDATVAYLFANSDDHEFAVASPPSGDAANGEALINSVGCLACHITEDLDRLAAGARRTFGQPLQNVGAKTSYEWLFDWVRDPRHFSSETYMPDLRLTDQEAADVATYLTTLEGPEGRLAEATYTQDDVTATLLDYVRSVLPTAEAEETGRGAVTRGTAARVGAARDWPVRLLQLPRDRRLRGYPADWDRALRGGFQAAAAARLRVRPRYPAHEGGLVQAEDAGSPLVRPEPGAPALEKLRMPNYGMSEEEATLFATAIMSLQADVQPLEAQVARLGAQ